MYVFHLIEKKRICTSIFDESRTLTVSNRTGRCSIYTPTKTDNRKSNRQKSPKSVGCETDDELNFWFSKTVRWEEMGTGEGRWMFTNCSFTGGVAARKKIFCWSSLVNVLAKGEWVRAEGRKCRKRCECVEDKWVPTGGRISHVNRLRERMRWEPVWRL